MTKEEFTSLQELHRSSGLSLLKFLKQEHISYSTYNYWKRKSAYALDQESEDSGATLAPITLKVPGVVPSSSVSGMTLLFPNGVRAHLSVGMEDSASLLINQYNCCHVLSE
jgi:putative transposase